MHDTITIIDYGSGNLHSAAKAFEQVTTDLKLPLRTIITDSAEEIKNSRAIILPGQGAFGDCIQNLKSHSQILDQINDSVLEQKTPFLGICVGMQLLADKGYEHGEKKGLGWLGGEVVPLQPQNKDLKIPHMGWNNIKSNDHELSEMLLGSTLSQENFYFIHSFRYKMKDNKNVIATCDYGETFPALIGQGNIIGCQFHPEKSQKSGLKFIGNFLSNLL